VREERIRQLNRYFFEELTNDTLPFWVKHARDNQFGGYATYVDRKGKLLNPDKSMWVQCRITWLFSRLYNVLEKREEWLELAQHGVEFLNKYGFDNDGRMFFKVTRDGKPLRKRRYLFTECFGIIAFAEYARAAGDETFMAKARALASLVLDTKNQSKAPEPKIYSTTRQMKTHAMTMILINVFQILREVDGAHSHDYSRQIYTAVEEVFRFFVKAKKKALLETVGPKGEMLLEFPEGRCVNPGHAIETCWFILEEARYRRDEELVKKIVPVLDWSLEIGWDEEYGGILYFVDVEGKQPEQLEWDMKLWWPHCEAIYATLLAYHLTGQAKYEKWFERVLDWSLRHFPDKECGEWIGYLHRDGSVALDFKGNHWKGPFHLPRQQLYTHLLLKEMSNTR